MGSRKTPARSSSGNGRYSNGNDSSGSNGSSRPGGCSYLSNVRPETRSTLCSMMAQLTEETQPSFETTLKSRAVSENCNVKFSCVVTGHPAPQLIWYKDDVQLDRYCGLPKYEIFRNGQNHILHIYNCTVEDAAIYQASASNCKGIVSCSSVLEVGEMNEFKIHQRYFAKLKQRAENRRREAEGKENQEPLRTISPDRTQRKRRSTMEAFLSMPSSTEDEGNEESHQAVAADSEARLVEAAVEKVEEKPVPLTNGAVSVVTNGHTTSENANKSGTYIYDSSQKVFTAHQPKTPFVKKKIRISSSAKVAKSDTPGEQASEERRAKEETVTSVAPACTDSVQSKGNTEEVMEVENIIISSVVDSDSRNMTEQLKSEVERPSKHVNKCVEVTLPSQKGQLPAALTSHSVTGSEAKQAAKHEKEVGRKDKEHIASTQLQSKSTATSLRMVKEDFSKKEHVTLMDVNDKSNTSTSASLTHRDIESVNALCEDRTDLPQRPCQQAGDQVSERETSPCQNSASVPRPALPSEVSEPSRMSSWELCAANTGLISNTSNLQVTQAHTMMNRNDAPVNLEPPLHCVMEARPPQRAPSERDTSTDDIQTPSLNCSLPVAIDKMTQDTWDHSRGSNESHSALFTDPQKSSIQSPGGGENPGGCKVSPNVLQSQVDTAIKTVEGTEIQVDEKVEGKEVGELLLQSESVAPKENVVEMETKSADLHVTDYTENKKTKDAEGKCADVIDVDATAKETEKMKMVEEGVSELHDPKSNTSKPAVPIPENTNLSDFQEIKKPVTKVISIAELLRSQIKALDSTLANSLTTLPLHADLVQDPTTATQTEDSKRKAEVKRSERKNGLKIDEIPPRNIKETLMEVYHQLNKTDLELIRLNQTQDAASPPVQALQKPHVIPPISVVDTGKTWSENVKHNTLSTSEDKLTLRSNIAEHVGQISGTPLTVIPIKARSQELNITVLDHAKDEPVRGKDMGFIQKLTPEINAKTRNTETLLHQQKMEEDNAKPSSLQSVQRLSTKSVPGTESNVQFTQQDSPMVEVFSRNPAPEASPLLKRRNCVSPIPSATAQELASGARRKILIPKAKPEEASEATPSVDSQTQKKEVSTPSSKLSPSPPTLSTSPSLPRQSPLLQPPGELSSPVERHSPLFSRRKMAPETLAPSQQPSEEIHSSKTEGKPAEKTKQDPFKAPQVIRKIRGETFADSSGHLKLWCQFFNVLSDSTIQWYKNEQRIAQTKRNAGDESQVNLAIVQASSKDSGVYGCTIANEYGTDSTDCLLSAEILAGMSLREDLGVGEEIEMTPMIFNKGVGDSGIWGNKFFGRIMMQESQIGNGCSHKVWRAKVIYGLEPVFESGNTCIIKARNPIAYEGKGESGLIDRNLDIIKQECKIQNLAREYCKIFSAEARAIENFGPSLEVLPVYLMYRPANTVPYATVEADLTGVYQKYSVVDPMGRIDMRTGTEVGQKCSALQHWIFQWTNGNLLLSRLEGVDTKITNVGVSVKSTGHQGLPVEGNPKVFEQFVSQHQCNYFCGLLSLRSLKVMESLLTPTKPKGSKSPLLQRKMAAGSSSPQTGRKAAGSPRLPRKTEPEGRNTPTQQKVADAPKVVKME